jgi:glycosyltransferase 2 family protein
MRKHLGTIIKLGITAVALFLVFQNVDFSDIWQRIKQADPFWVLLAFLLVNGSLVVRAYRWQLLLIGLQAKVRFQRLVELYFASNFFNSVFPSGITGDVLRIVEVAQDVPKSIAAGTVIVDRATGLMALFLLALLSLPFRPANFPPFWLGQIVAVCVLGLVGGFIVFEGSMVRKCGRFIPRPLQKIWQTADHVLLAVQAIGWKAIWQAMGISVIFNLMQIAWWWCAGKALGYDISLNYYFLVVPIMALAILLPSIGGLGIRELFATLLFTGAGISAGEAAVLSLLVFAIERISGLLGAPIYIFSTLRRDQQQSLS